MKLNKIYSYDAFYLFYFAFLNVVTRKFYVFCIIFSVTQYCSKLLSLIFTYASLVQYLLPIFLMLLSVYAYHSQRTRNSWKVINMFYSCLHSLPVSDALPRKQ